MYNENQNYRKNSVPATDTGDSPKPNAICCFIIIYYISTIKLVLSRLLMNYFDIFHCDQLSELFESLSISDAIIIHT